jgi:DNA-dependent RNA polymerase auxiliary subunit epsilon
VPVVNAERLIVSHGTAIHQFNDVEWREETKRLYVSLTHDRIRALVDLNDFDFDLVAHIADRLALATNEREAPKRIRIAPHLAAAILPQLKGVADLWQRAGGRDGKGQLIDEVPASKAMNWFRPSYRVRPIRKPFSLFVRCDVTVVDPTLPRAIAVIDGNRLLIDDGRDVYPSRVTIEHVDAAAPDGEIESRCR